MNKFSKRYRQIQRLRNWMYEFVDFRLLLAMTFALIALNVLLDMR